MSGLGGGSQDLESVSSSWAAAAGTRELVVTLAACEDALRAAGAEPARRQELLARQGVIVRVLRRRRARTRGR